MEAACSRLSDELPEATSGTWKPAKRPQAAAPRETGGAGEKRPGGYETAAELVAAAFAKQGPAAGRWAYRDAAEKPVGLVLRFEEAGGRKTFRQASRCPVDGRWRAEAMPKPRPLYRLPEVLAADPSLPVDVVEGEKAADAGAEAGLVTVTAAGGSGAPSMQPTGRRFGAAACGCWRTMTPRGGSGRLGSRITWATWPPTCGW